MIVGTTHSLTIAQTLGHVKWYEIIVGIFLMNIGSHSIQLRPDTTVGAEQV